ncbi:type II secretion system F family protein [Zongyangia hominis]|uniref:Type II secretion system F family protein n=1 Tax=Zongyangia hominis TaxID=2763677 RepID=A0A926EBA7_9FIRM|nr:type II secretion system F family protein [Zongyangia hominis]MBC8571370.1 type II secretion system F family protein [Zongyangia hominis]
MAENAEQVKQSKKEQLSSSDIAAFCSQLSLMLRAGIPAAEGLGILRDDIQDAKGKKLISGIAAQVDMGEPLFAALRASGAFPKYMVDMVEIGEKTGRLDDVTASLSSYYERDEYLSRTIKNAVAYPAVMIVMMAVVIVVLITKVLPIFSDVLSRLGATLSPLAQGLLNFGTALARYGALILGVIAVIAMAYLILRNTRWSGAFLHKIYTRGFATKRFAATVAAGRFANAMALMLQSGLDTQESLDMAYQLVDDEAMRDKIERCGALMKEGVTFSQAVQDTEIFSGVNARMLRVGFQAGALDKVMADIARRYEDEVDERMGRAISLLEPTLVAVLSIIVGMILLSVMLPLMSIMSSIG